MIDLSKLGITPWPWVDVKESLPVDGEYVLGIYKKHLPVIVMWHEQERRFTSTGEQVFIDHWMPLPDPPAIHTRR